MRKSTRPLHRSGRPATVLVYTDPTGMDFARREFYFASNTFEYGKVSFSGDFDGGDIAIPTDCNDYLNTPFDGGVL